VLLAEHKSRGENLDKATSQAFAYLELTPETELPKFVIISDFARIRLYDLESGAEYGFAIEELPNKIQLFGFISGYTRRTYKDQDPVNIDVALKLGELHDALKLSGYAGHNLEVLLVRLVYCLFADDTGIFPKDHFRFFLEESTDESGANLGAMLGLLFQLLDTPVADRQRELDEDLQQFPHVNGALFEQRIDLPVFNRMMRRLLLEACAFDWSKVSPAIFGSLFQSVMEKMERRNLGAHYTSEQNILKVVRGLFLDELEAEFESVQHDSRKLLRFQQKLIGLKFFDPACGCGNFLVITYREMRRLELEVLKQLRLLTKTAQGQLYVSQIDVDSFYGIEVEEFPAQIATIALWITDHIANKELSIEFGVERFRLPLRKTPHVLNTNALRVDWNSVVSPVGNETDTTLFILGNPPFVGKKARNDVQNEDMKLVFGSDSDSGVLDYVCAWYLKASEFIQGTRIKVAFVSTSSITQGEQVGVLWNYLWDLNIKIHFAHRTFKWMNEARGQAAVHCVIIGFANFAISTQHLFDYETPTSEPHQIESKNINPYLIDQADLVIRNRNSPIGDFPKLVFGNMPNDDGRLLFTDEERAVFVTEEPAADRFIVPFISAREFIHGVNRWCLWLKDVSPDEWRSLPSVVLRVQAVREFRSKSKRPTTRRLAELPYLFGEIRQPDTDYVLIPRHSSENRRYIPIAFFYRR
jgi:hypothetical protein